MLVFVAYAFNSARCSLFLSFLPLFSLFSFDLMYICIYVIFDMQVRLFYLFNHLCSFIFYYLYFSFLSFSYFICLIFEVFFLPLFFYLHMGFIFSLTQLICGEKGIIELGITFHTCMSLQSNPFPFCFILLESY